MVFALDPSRDRAYLLIQKQNKVQSFRISNLSSLNPDFIDKLSKPRGIAVQPSTAIFFNRRYEIRIASKFLAQLEATILSGR